MIETGYEYKPMTQEEIEFSEKFHKLHSTSKHWIYNKMGIPSESYSFYDHVVYPFGITPQDVGYEKVRKYFNELTQEQKDGAWLETILEDLEKYGIEMYEMIWKNYISVSEQNRISGKSTAEMKDKVSKRLREIFKDE